MERISRSKALESGEKYYFTGNPCKQGHISKRYVKNCTCYECQLGKSQVWREDNHEYHSEYNESYRHENKERVKEINDRYYLNLRTTNYDLYLERCKEHSDTYLSKPEAREDRRKYNKEWIKRNSGKVNSYTAKRRAALLQATPSWYEKDEIADLYHKAAWLTETRYQTSC